jgi:hypothetical protein
MTDRTEMSTADEEIVPVWLVLGDERGVTLYVPEWSQLEESDSGDEVTQFLGRPGEILLFPNPAALAVFAAADDPDQPIGLRGHPRWGELTERPEVDFTPFEDDEFDLATVPRLLTNPGPAEVARAGELIAFAWELALHLRADEVRELLETEAFEQVQTEPQSLLGWRGRSRLTALRAALAEHWDDLLARLAEGVRRPQVEGREEHPLAPPPQLPPWDGTGAVPLEDVVPLETVGIGMGGRTGFTLVHRPQPDEQDDDGDDDDAVPLFAGRPGGIRICTTLEGLADFVREDTSSQLVRLPGWYELSTRADVDLTPYDDACTDLDAVPDLIGTHGPGNVDEVETAVTFVSDVARFAHLDDVTAALEDPAGPIRHAIDIETGGSDEQLSETEREAFAAEWSRLVARVSAQFVWDD